MGTAIIAPITVPVTKDGTEMIVPNQSTFVTAAFMVNAMMVTAHVVKVGLALIALCHFAWITAMAIVTCQVSAYVFRVG